jgi:histone H3/H4
MSDIEDTVPIHAASDDDDTDEEIVAAAVVDDDDDIDADAVDAEVDISMDDNDNDNDNETRPSIDSVDGDADTDIEADAAATPTKVKHDDEHETATPRTGKKSKKTPGTDSKKRRRKSSPRKQKAGGIPSVKDLGIPFRAVKRIMKIDKDIGTVQNEAAMVATFAVELFVEKMVKESNANARKRGRNTVKYEDLGEVRASHSNLSFLNTLLP